MRVVLHVVEGPAAGRRFTLSSGQIAQVGRTEWADFAIPDDGQLAEVHFALEAAPSGCRLRKTGEAPLLVNGTASDAALLRHGDRIQAGRSAFRIDVEGSLREMPAAGQGPGESAPAASAPQPRAHELAPKAPLSADAQALLDEQVSCDDYLNRLLDAGLSADAIALAAAAMAPPDAVRWAAGCVRQALGDAASPPETAALDAADQWAAEPTEEHRRAAEAAATALNFDGPAAFAALAAFWNGESLAPVGLPPAPVPENLYVRGISGALLLAAPRLGPEKIDHTLRAFLAAR